MGSLLTIMSEASGANRLPMRVSEGEEMIDIVYGAGASMTAKLPSCLMATRASPDPGLEILTFLSESGPGNVSSFNAIL